jgi:sugar lactone lactonase YvrE
MSVIPAFETLAEGLQFPEAPYWSNRDDCLYLVEWTGDSLLVFREGKVETLFRTQPGDGPSGLCQDAQGNFWITLYTSRKLACFNPCGERLLVVQDYQGAPFRGPCDLVGAAGGGVFFTDSGDFEDDWRTGRPVGVVYYCSPAGELTEVDRELCYSNGIALSPDGKRLYVNEHRRNRTLEYILRPDRGFSQKKVLYTFDRHCLLEAESAFELGPDGLCVASDGDLWVAHYGGGKVVRIGPSGEVRDTFFLPRGRRPTNVAVDAEDQTLFITEAEFGLLYRVKIGK